MLKSQQILIEDPGIKPLLEALYVRIDWSGNHLVLLTNGGVRNNFRSIRLWEFRPAPPGRGKKGG